MVRTFLVNLKGLCSFSSERGLPARSCEVEPFCCKLFRSASGRAVHGTASSVSFHLWNSAAHSAPRPIRLRPTGSVIRFSKKGSPLRLVALLPSHMPENRGWPQQMSLLMSGRHRVYGKCSCQSLYVSVILLSIFFTFLLAASTAPFIFGRYGAELWCWILNYWLSWSIMWLFKLEALLVMSISSIP